MNKAAIVSALKDELKVLSKNKATVEAMIAKLSGDSPASTKKTVKRKYTRRALGTAGGGLGGLVGVAEEPAPAPAPAEVEDPELEAKRKRAEELKAKMKKAKGGGAKGPLGRKTRRPPEAAS